LNIEIVGIIAGVLTTFCGIPLVIYVHKTGKTRDLTYGWLFMLNTGVVLWAVYAYMKNDHVLMFANIACFALNFYLLLKKLQAEPLLAKNNPSSGEA